MEPETPEEIAISLLHYPVQVLGPGRRIGIWTQGCSIRCPGCLSRHAWEFDGGKRMPVTELLRRVAPHLATCDGVTITGGEPFDQPGPLDVLLRGLQHQGCRDIMLYSGYPYEDLAGRFPALLGRLSALVDGPYRQGEEGVAHWHGSANQRLFVLTRNREVAQRYERYAAAERDRPCLQLVREGGKLFVLGIPRQRDRDGFRELRVES